MRWSEAANRPYTCALLPALVPYDTIPEVDASWDIRVPPTVQAPVVPPLPPHAASPRQDPAPPAVPMPPPAADFRETGGSEDAWSTFAGSIPKTELAKLHGVFLSTYEMKGVVLASDLLPSAAVGFPAVYAARVFDAAVAAGAVPLGLAPAHMRRGRYVHPTPGDAPRVFTGLPKPPYHDGTLYSYR